MVHFFTSEQGDFIRSHVKGRSNQELTDVFNAHFKLSLHVNQVKAYKHRHKITSGLTGRFEKGRTPHNKGKKRWWDAGVESQFKKGNKAWNWMPIGSERINADGYVDIKVDDGKKQKNWKGKHIVLWEKHHGCEVQKGHVVIFGDSDNRNFNIDNLLLVSRAQLARLNKLRLIKDDTELTKTGIVIAEVYNKIGERKREKREGTHEHNTGNRGFSRG